jgi:hypothetical protein
LESTDNGHRISIVAICQKAHRGKLKIGSEPWTRCFPAHTLIHVLGTPEYSSGLTLTCLLLQCRSLKPTLLCPPLKLSHSDLSVRRSACVGYREGASSREALPGRAIRNKHATSRKFVEDCRVGGPVCVTPSLAFCGEPAVASTRPLLLDDRQFLVVVVADHQSSLSSARVNSLYQLLGCDYLTETHLMTASEDA